MEIILTDNEIVKEVLLDDLLNNNTTDRGKVIIKGEFLGDRDKGKSNFEKEITALDAIEYGPSQAAIINNVPQSSASKYHDGLDIKDEETRTRVLNTRHNIANKAVSKLMDTLNLFDPNCLEKQMDIVKAAGTLSGIVERVSMNGKNVGNSVTLNLYAPKQNKLEKYDVIDV